MRNPDRETIFRFKQFAVVNHRSAMKVGTDGVLLGAWALSSKDAGSFLGSPDAPCPNSLGSILDVGCGTGLIALMMAQRFPDAEVNAIEIDSDSATEAAANFKASPWAGRIHLIHGDFLDNFLPLSPCDTGCRSARKFDLIICNPPFFTNGLQAPECARRQARHETSLTLSSFLEHSSMLLSPSGVIALILPADRLTDLREALHSLSQQPEKSLVLSRLCIVSTVPTKPPRRLLAELRYVPRHQSIDNQSFIEEQLSIHDGHGNFSEEYKNLTRNFYLNF